jgi:hypothetical protein
MQQHQKPMLNSPVEVHSVAADEFAKNVITRLEASHAARRALNYLFQAVRPDAEPTEPDKRCFTELNSTLNRKAFGAAG